MPSLLIALRFFVGKPPKIREIRARVSAKRDSLLTLVLVVVKVVVLVTVMV